VSSRGLQIDIVVPEGIDDPARPSGGNAYDRRIYREARPNPQEEASLPRLRPTSGMELSDTPLKCPLHKPERIGCVGREVRY